VKPFLLLVTGLLLIAPDAGAQVIINPAALAQLAGIAPPVVSAPPVIREKPRKIAYRRVYRMRAKPVLAASRMVAKPAPLPAKPVIQPAAARPAPPPAAKPLLPATIKFASGGAALPGNSAAMLKPFCAHPGGMIMIDAYAAADPSDPSSAPRLSMSRAFAIRDALTACGIPSSSIIPRANGAAKVPNPNAAEISASP
jgi:hypothetical protein